MHALVYGFLGTDQVDQNSSNSSTCDFIDRQKAAYSTETQKPIHNSFVKRYNPPRHLRRQAEVTYTGLPAPPSARTQTPPELREWYKPFPQLRGRLRPGGRGRGERQV